MRAVNLAMACVSGPIALFLGVLIVSVFFVDKKNFTNENYSDIWAGLIIFVIAFGVFGYNVGKLIGLK